MSIFSLRLMNSTSFSFNSEMILNMTEYEGGHQKLPVAQDVVDDFVKQYKGEPNVLLSEKDSDDLLLQKNINSDKIASDKSKERRDIDGYSRDNREGTERVSNKSENKRRRGSSDIGNLSVGGSALDSDGENKIPYGERRRSKGSREKNVGLSTPSSASKATTGREKTNGARFLEAVKNGDETTARALLDEQAKRTGFVPARAHG